MCSKKKVSIIIPSFNRKYTIDRAIDSCLNQSHDNVEVIVCDDQSTDGTYDYLVSKYGCNKKIIVYTTSGYGKGANVARNVALKNATGDYFAFLDSDDYLTQDSIADRLRVFEKSNDKVGLVYGNVYFEKNKHRRKCVFSNIEEFDQNKYLFSELALCIFSSVMVSRKALEIIGDLDNNLPAWQDDDLVIRIGSVMPISYCGKFVACIGYSRISVSRSIRNNYEGLRLLIEKNRSNIVRYCSVGRLIKWYVRIFSMKLKLAGEREQNIIYRVILYRLSEEIKNCLLKKWFCTLYV